VKKGAINLFGISMSIALACAILSGAARADTYDYTGPPMTYGDAFVDDHITLTMITNGSIAGLDTPTDITPDITSLTFNLMDGATAVFSDTIVPSVDEEVTTDGQGDILTWEIDFESAYGPESGPTDPSGQSIQEGGSTEYLGSNPFDGWGVLETNDFASSVDGIAGVWTDMTLTPEPRTISQLLLGLLLLALLAKRTNSRMANR
jgi:hypothetical protein